VISQLGGGVDTDEEVTSYSQSLHPSSSSSSSSSHVKLGRHERKEWGTSKKVNQKQPRKELRSHRESFHLF
jgi:hypothetical protein